MLNNMLLSIGTGGIVALSLLGVVLACCVIYLCLVPMKAWFTALFSGAYIPTFKLLGMKSRKLDVRKIATNYVLVKKSKLNIKLNEIESLVQNGGNVEDILKAMKMAEDGGIKMPFALACSISLANNDIFQVVQEALNFKVIVVDDVRAFSKDEKELIVKVKASIKLNIEKYVDGLGEEGLQTAISAKIIDNIAGATTYKEILSAPNEKLISNLNLAEISGRSRYDLKEVSIAKIEVGRDLKIEKDIQNADKEKAYAQVEAEKRKHFEEIKAIQMKNKTEAMKAAMLEAEADVPRALSAAIKEGRFSVMDYYKLMNLQADTALRRAIMSGENKDKNNSFDFDDEGDLFE